MKKKDNSNNDGNMGLKPLIMLFGPWRIQFSCQKPMKTFEPHQKSMFSQIICFFHDPGKFKLDFDLSASKMNGKTRRIINDSQTAIQTHYSQFFIFGFFKFGRGTF